MADSTTLQEGSLNASPTSFALCTVPLASLAGHFSPTPFPCFGNPVLWNQEHRPRPTIYQGQNIPNLCKDGDVECVSDHARLQRMQQTSQASTGPRELTSLKTLLTLLCTISKQNSIIFSSPELDTFSMTSASETNYCIYESNFWLSPPGHRIPSFLIPVLTVVFQDTIPPRALTALSWAVLAKVIWAPYSPFTSQSL